MSEQTKELTTEERATLVAIVVASRLGLVRGPSDLPPEHLQVIQRAYDVAKAHGQVSEETQNKASLFGFDTPAGAEKTYH